MPSKGKKYDSKHKRTTTVHVHHHHHGKSSSSKSTGTINATEQFSPELCTLRKQRQIRKLKEKAFNKLVDKILGPIIITRRLSSLKHCFLIIQYLRKIIESEVKKYLRYFKQEQIKQKETPGKYIDMYQNCLENVQWNNIIIGRVKNNFNLGTHEHRYSKYILKPKYWSKIEHDISLFEYEK